jgi:Redoxin
MSVGVTLPKWMPILLFLIQVAPAWAGAYSTTFLGRDLRTSRPSPMEVSVADKKALAVVFLSARCPCSKSHEAPLGTLAQTHPEIRFVGIHSNSDESEEEAVAHFSQTDSRLPFPVLQDPGGEWAKQFGANKTPHVFLLSPEGTAVFQGGVDNTHKAEEATKHYLRTALDAMVAGKKPEVTEARAIGCYIKR